MERFTAGIPIRDILVEHDNSARFQAANRGRIRPVVCENIRRMLACRTPALGFHVYACPECGEERVVPQSCKSGMCSSCGKVASDHWASAVLNDSLDVAYNHLVLIECHWCHQGLMVPLKYPVRSGEVFRLPRDVLRALRGREKTPQL